MLEPMDAHRLAEQRSLAYHRVVAERLRSDGRVLPVARARVTEWLAEGRSTHYARQWERLLAGPLDVLCEALVADSEEGRARRQATPFAGALDPRERWRIWQTERERAEGR